MFKKHTQFQRVEQLLNNQGYITEQSIVMSVFLAMQLKKPLLIEGPAGVGKNRNCQSDGQSLGNRSD